MGGTEQLDGAARAEIAAADADDDEKVAVGADLFGRRVDAGELLPVKIPRQGEPAVKIAARAGVLPQLGRRRRHLGRHAVHFTGSDKAFQILFPQSDSHSENLFSGKDTFLILFYPKTAGFARGWQRLPAGGARCGKPCGKG